MELKTHEEHSTRLSEILESIRGYRRELRVMGLLPEHKALVHQFDELNSILGHVAKWLQYLLIFIDERGE